MAEVEPEEDGRLATLGAASSRVQIQQAALDEYPLAFGLPRSLDSGCLLEAEQLSDGGTDVPPSSG